MDLISVIVPVYNVKSFLEYCLDSILEQIYDNIELILIDDGSTDESGKICDEYAYRYNAVRVFHKKNEGLVRARMDGVKLAHGIWIAFVDADDWIAPTMISELYGMANSANADVVISAAYIANDSWTELKRNGVNEGIYYGKSLEELKNNILGGEEYFSFSVLPYLWNKLWRKDLILESLQNMDPSITVGEDVAIGFPAILRAKKIVVTNSAYYFYRQNRFSMLNQKSNEQFEIRNALRLYNHLKNEFSSVGYDFLTCKALKRFLVHQLLTRAYGYTNQMLRWKGLFPFIENIEKPIVVYGAGAFGKAVYEYAKIHFQVKVWIDSNAVFLRSLGYAVVTLEEADLDANDIVVIPIFVNKTAIVIRDAIIKKGVRENNIISLKISDVQEEKLANMLE